MIQQAPQSRQTSTYDTVFAFSLFGFENSASRVSQKMSYRDTNDTDYLRCIPGYGYELILVGMRSGEVGHQIAPY